jgi:hypothetical protein
VSYLSYRIHEIYGKLHRKIRFYRYEFTIPFDLQAKVAFEGLAELGRLAKETFLEYLGKLSECQLGILQVPQWWHSGDPFGGCWCGGFFPHVHGVCFDFAFDGEKVIPFSQMYISNDAHFVRLRALWRSKLEARFGKSKAKDVDCYIRYEEGGDELTHRLSYMFRSPLFDVYQLVKGRGIPSKYDVDWVRKMLSGRGHAQRVNYYGWLASVCQSPKSCFMRFLRLELLNRRFYNAERKKVFCPNCGCLMERVAYAVDDTDSLVARGEPFLARVPPWLVVLNDGG